MTKFHLTQKYLHDHFNYDPDTGIFSRKIKTSNAVVIGKPLLAGKKDGRISININNVTYRAHRLAWLYMYGEMPSEIDHINNDGTDNRICNLRIATRNQNVHNTRRPSNNKSGVKGISWDKKRNSWFVRIGYDGKNYPLGRYKDFDEAVKVIAKARQKYHGNFANFG